MVLVTGATGILGQVIVLELLKQGKKVRATRRASSNINTVKQSLGFYTDNAEYYFQKIEWVSVDFENLDSLREALQDIKEVYHCAAEVSFNPKNKKKMYQTNIYGTKNLLYIAQEKNIEKLLFVSSIAVLDGTNEMAEIDENSYFNPKLSHSAYAISKHFSEMEVWRAAAEGMNIAIINPGIIIGSGNWKKSSGTIFDTFRKIPFTFSGGTAYVDVRDVANIAIQIMEKNIFGERFILISENKRYEEIANYIREKLNLKKTKIIPNTILKIGQCINTLLGWAIPPLRIMNKANIDAVTTYTHISNKKIKDKLEYNFIPIKKSIDYHIENYKKSLDK